MCLKRHKNEGISSELDHLFWMVSGRTERIICRSLKWTVFQVNLDGHSPNRMSHSRLSTKRKERDHPVFIRWTSNFRDCPESQSLLNYWPSTLNCSDRVVCLGIPVPKALEGKGPLTYWPSILVVLAWFRMNMQNTSKSSQMALENPIQHCF